MVIVNVTHHPLLQFLVVIPESYSVFLWFLRKNFFKLKKDMKINNNLQFFSL